MRIRYALIGIPICAVFAIPIAWYAWNVFPQGLVISSCYGERLILVARRLEAYANEHDGRLPPVEEVKAIAAGENPDNLICFRAKAPFRWNERLATISLASPNREVIAWCPPGAHWRCVGAIVVEDGRIFPDVMETEELEERLGKGVR